MRFTAALLAGKLIGLLTSFTGRGTNITGAAALRLCPSLLSRFRIKGKIIAVTGSNGKTSTANAVRSILKSCGYSVCGNYEGSNLTGGVATALIKASDLAGNIKSDFVILEVDERYSRLIFKDFHPDILLVTNLFRDQLTRNGNVDVIFDILNNMIHPDTLLVLNANDPISSRLAPKNARAYYAMERTPLSTDSSPCITHDARVCPVCAHRLKYEYYHYNHIGRYRCESCSFSQPEARYTAKDVDMEKGSFSVDGRKVGFNYKNLYHVLNMTGAIAACAEAGVGLDEACRAASEYKISTLRYDEFDIGGRRCAMILSKNQNPVSYDQSISYVLADRGEKCVAAYINNINHTDNKDTTWLWDIAFERLAGEVGAFICAGPRGCDLAVRLRAAGFDKNRILLCESLSDMPALIKNTSGAIYLMTELYDAKRITEAIRNAQ